MEGREAMDRRDLPVWSTFIFGGVNSDASEDGSTVRDLRIATGLGEMIGGDVGALAAPPCHRSNTGTDFLPPEFFFSGKGGVRGDSVVSWLLACTMLRTNPRPCNRLILGVGSFGGGGRRNAGDGFGESGTCGPSDRRGDGWMGRARDGVVIDAFDDEDGVGDGGGRFWDDVYEREIGDGGDGECRFVVKECRS